MSVEKKFICSRCSGEIFEENNGMMSDGVLAVHFIRNDLEIPMWKKLLLGKYTKQDLLCRECMYAFEDFMNGGEVKGITDLK